MISSKMMRPCLFAVSSQQKKPHHPQSCQTSATSLNDGASSHQAIGNTHVRFITKPRPPQLST